MQFEQIILLVVGLVTLSLGLNILNKKVGSDKKTIYLLAIIFSLMVWTLTIFLTLAFAHVANWNLFLSRSSFATAVLIAIFFTYLVREFNNQVNELIFNILIFFTLLLIPLSFSSLVVEGVTINNGELRSIIGIGQLFYSFILAVIFLYSFLLLAQALGKAKDINIREQLKYILIGGIISFVLSFTSNLLLPYFGLEIRSLGPLSILVYVGCTYYAIRKYRFLKLNVALSEVLTYILSAFLPFSMFFIFYSINVSLWSNIYSLSALVAGFFESLVFIYIFSKFQTYIVLLLQKYFINNAQVKEHVDHYVNTISKILDLREIYSRTQHLLKSNFKIKDFNIVRVENGQLMYLFQDFTPNITLELFLEVRDWIERNNKLYADIVEVAHSAPSLYDKLFEYSIEILFPLAQSSYLIISSKDNGSVYNSYEISLLIQVVQNLNLSIQRGFLYEQEKDFNDLLKTKVEAATENINDQRQKLQIAYDKLKEASQKEHDMIDIMGHELRTPATVIKLAIYLLEQKNTDEACKKYINEIKGNVENEIELINTLLHASKLDNSKLEIDPTYEDFTQIVHEVVTEEQSSAVDKGLSLYLLPTSDPIPKTMLDKHRIREAVTNYLTNAIKYTDKGVIEVKMGLSDDKKYIIFSVKDNGIGFKQEDKDYLFQKFHRLNNYIGSNESKHLVRPGGTGLGLYVVKGMIELHEGKVWAESEGINQGSTFYFSIPVKQPTNDVQQHSDSKEMDMFTRMNLRENSAK